MALTDYYDRINHVGVPTEDMAATVRFYTDLGFTLIYETKNGDQQVCFLENGSIQIEAYTVEHAANIRGAIDHLALNCTDIEAAFEEAKKLPYKILEGITALPFWDHGIRYFLIEGPNKEVIELVQKL